MDGAQGSGTPGCTVEPVATASRAFASGAYGAENTPGFIEEPIVEEPIVWEPIIGEPIIEEPII